MRIGPLAWAQYVNWVAQYAWRAPLTPALISVMRFEHLAGESPATVRESVAAVVGRHEALRSVFTIGAGGQPFQRVRPVGELEPELRCVAGTPDGTIAPADHEWLFRRAEVERDSPVRVLTLTNSEYDAVATLVGVHRLVADHFAEEVLVKEIRTELDARRAGTSARHGDVDMHPLDIVEYQQSPAGAKQNERALAYWTSALHQAPQAFFPATRAPRAGDGSSHTLSVSLRRREALSALATELRTTEPTVLTAAMLVALTAVVGRHDCLVATVTANRFQAGHRNAVCPLVDRGPLDVRVDPDADFAAFVRVTQAGLMRAQRHGYHDPGALRAASQAVAGARGIYLHRLPVVSVVPDEGAIAAPQNHGDGEVQSENSAARFDAFQLRARYNSSAVAIELLAGDNVVPSDICARVVGAVGHLLDVLPTSSGQALGEITEPIRGNRTSAGTVGTLWFDATAVRDLIQRSDDVAEAAVLTPAAAGEPVRAVIVPARDGVTASSVGRWVAEHLPEDAALVCPQRYLLVDRPGTELDGAQGDTADPAGSYDRHPASEDAIRDAFMATHGDEPDLAKSYLLAGGRLERAPGFVEILKEQGFSGLSTDDVLGLRPLRALARTLVSPAG